MCDLLIVPSVVLVAGDLNIASVEMREVLRVQYPSLHAHHDVLTGLRRAFPAVLVRQVPQYIRGGVQSPSRLIHAVSFSGFTHSFQTMLLNQLIALGIADIPGLFVLVLFHMIIVFIC
jgi:hypothetical protein